MAKQDAGSEKPGLESPAETAGRLFGADGPFASVMKNFDPAAMMQQSMDLSRSMMQIAMGTSDIAPDKRDWRFKDDAWTSNPFYHRISQAYLAMSDAVEAMIPDDLNWEDKARAQLAASIVTSSFAPTNTLLGNPAAINKTIETGGSNLVKGFKAFLDDLQNNGGMPRQVDATPFEVGRNMAVTPGKIVLRTEMFELIHYKPSTDQVHALPVLLVPPQIGRYYFTDLTPGRSFAEYVVSQGLQYFAISWRNPSPDERAFGMEAYVAAVIEAMEAIMAITDQPKVNMVGFCAGGITTAITAACLAAKGRDLVNSFTLCVAMIDFDNDASLGAFRLPAMLTVAKAQSSMKGVLPGSDLSKIFAWLRPNDLIWNYWVNNYLMGEEPAPFDILAWNNDSSNMAAQLHTDFLNIFDNNLLIEPGAYEVLGAPVDLSEVTCDMFIVGAVTDHLTPWKACYKSGRLIGGERTFALSNGGHVAALVNPPGNPKAFHYIAPAAPEDADQWLEGAEKLTGSWWESWTKWCGARSGALVPAPKALGSKHFKPLMDAPGDYVRQ